MPHRPTVASVVLLLVVTTPVAAQSPRTAERSHSVGAGAQWAYPYRESGDLTATPGIDASYREWVLPRVAIELEFGTWRRARTGTYSLAGYQLPPGHENEPLRASYTTRFSSYSAGVNVLGRIPLGRVAIIAGGGPGIFAERRNDSSVVNGTLETWPSRSTHVGVQSLSAVELHVTDRLIGFGGARAEWRAIDVLITYPVAGVRVSF